MVRGIGVAVIRSRCGSREALERSFARSSTPKRCCSSTMTRPSEANCVPSAKRACVPMTSAARPSAAAARAVRRSATGAPPNTSATSMPIGARSRFAVAAC